MDAGLPHRNRADAGGEGALGQAAVTDHLAMAGVVAAVAATVDPVGDLGLNGLGESCSAPWRRRSVRMSWVGGSGTMRGSQVE